MDKGAENYNRFLSGDESGLYEIIRQYKDGLILYLNSIVSDLHMAEELAEDTFVKICLKRPHYSRSGSFKTWLYTIGKRLALDRLRQKKREHAVSIELCPEQADEQAELYRNYLRREQSRTLLRCMGQLSPAYRQVLWLTYFEGFDHRQTALIMGKTVHGIDTLVYRARNALKQVLEKEGFEYEKF